MTDVVLLIGLPGSGKTTLAQTKFVPQGYYLVDDPRSLETVKEALEQHDKVVITDPLLTDPGAREAALSWFGLRGCQVSCIYFDNNPERATANLKLREDGRGPINVKAMSRFYTIPEDGVVVPVYEPI